MIVFGPPVVEWVAKRTAEFGNYGAAFGIGVQVQGRLVAGVVYNEFNGVNMNMHTAALPKVRWLTKESLWYFFDYPFNRAKVNRVTALVGEGNVKSRKLVEGVGFSLETTLEGADPTGDLLVYAMWRDECRWLNLERPKHERMAA